MAETIIEDGRDDKQSVNECFCGMKYSFNENKH